MPSITQLGVKTEAVYATPLTVTKFYPLISDNVKLITNKMETNARSSGGIFRRNNSALSIPICAEGDLVLPMFNRGLGIYLQHMLGAAAVAGPADTAAYTHTFTVATLTALGLSAQTNRPFHAGTSQPFTWAGGKVTAWSIESTVQNEAVLTLTLNFDSETTATALASASYATDLELLSWASTNSGLTIAGTGIPAVSWKISGSNSLKTQDSRFHDPQVEPIANNFRDIAFEFTGDFESLNFYNLFSATTTSGQFPGSPGMVFKLESPSLITGAATTKPSLTLTVAAPRMDDVSINNADLEPTMQTVSGVVRYNGTDSPVSAVYVTADATP